MHFKQRVYTPEGALQGEYEGHMWYKAPDSFRVEYVYPETEVIITNGRGYSDYIPGDDELVQGGLEDIIFVSPFMMLDNISALKTTSDLSLSSYVPIVVSISVYSLKS